MQSLYTISFLSIAYSILIYFPFLMSSRSLFISVFNLSDENETRQFSVIDLNNKNFVRDVFSEKYSDVIKINLLK